MGGAGEWEELSCMTAPISQYCNGDQQYNGQYEVRCHDTYIHVVALAIFDASTTLVFYHKVWSAVVHIFIMAQI